MARLLLGFVALALGVAVGAAMVAVGADGGLSLLTGAILAAGLGGVWQGRI